MNNKIRVMSASIVLSAMPIATYANSIMISTGLPNSHNWSKNYMSLFIDQVKETSAIDVDFIPFYGGELVAAGKSLDALQGGTIGVAAPLLAPYHGGSFPLTDVTQLPTYNTTSQMVTKAFQSLMDSDEVIKDGKTFYEYEIESKGIQAWAIGATPAYSISTTGKRIKSPNDFNGLPLRVSSSIHTLAANELGATPVSMPATAMYEGLSRGTIDGTLQSIADWSAYSLEPILKYSLTGIAFGHWESYLAINSDVWDSLSENEQQSWDGIARQVALLNANLWEENTESVRDTAEADHSAEFVTIKELSPEMQAYVAKAAANIWKSWIDQMERNGHPGRRTAKIYAKLIQEEGGNLPDGVNQYLDIRDKF